MLSDESVLALASLPKLKRIGFARVRRASFPYSKSGPDHSPQVPNITDRSIDALAEMRGNKLERAHFSYCPHISVKAIENLLSQCRNLDHLSLTNVDAFLDPEYHVYCRPPPKVCAHLVSLYAAG